MAAILRPSTRSLLYLLLPILFRMFVTPKWSSSSNKEETVGSYPRRLINIEGRA
ncbi:MAG: hypothetical protein MJE68_20965 [Proteobacteria bacterium]|nr:hypothetical protein [Pseudomonadota bacterium]